MTTEDEKQIVREVYKRRSDAATRAAVTPLSSLNRAKKPKLVRGTRPQSKVK